MARGEARHVKVYPRMHDFRAYFVLVRVKDLDRVSLGIQVKNYIVGMLPCRLDL